MSYLYIVKSCTGNTPLYGCALCMCRGFWFVSTDYYLEILSRFIEHIFYVQFVVRILKLRIYDYLCSRANTITSLVFKHIRAYVARQRGYGPPVSDGNGFFLRDSDWNSLTHIFFAETPLGLYLNKQKPLNNMVGPT